jgi:phosphoribosylanthranilate isomerase
LAGGINPDNIKSVLASCHPYGIDVSSGVETNRLKDPDKIRQVITAVRNVNSKEAAQP